MLSKHINIYLYAVTVWWSRIPWHDFYGQDIGQNGFINNKA